MAKFDIKDGFWRLDCAEGQEWNFSYVLPQEEGQPIRLVVPNSLQMGWVESPAYFCTASETARDLAAWHAERPVGQVPNHKFLPHAMSDERVQQLPATADNSDLRYFLDVYVDDFIQLAIPTSQQQLEHVANAVLTGIHEVFPAHTNPGEDPISHKKLLKLDGQWSAHKDLLGFHFCGLPGEHSMVLEQPKREFLLVLLHKWLRASTRARTGIPFAEFESVTQKIRHAFTAIPCGRGLLTPCNCILSLRPPIVFLHRNTALRQTIRDCRTLLRESSAHPTPCKELVMGEPDFVGIKDASIHGVGGVIVGHRKACRPTVFRVEWPPDIKAAVLQTNQRRGGYLTNSDLEMAGLLFLWLVMEEVCDITPGAHIALFSDNSPTVSWVRRLAAKGSRVAGQLIRAVALRLKMRHVSPLTPLHIAGKHNAMTDVPSRSFGSEPRWYCRDHASFLTMFNDMFPLPSQNSWTNYQISSKTRMRVISILRMRDSAMDEWRRLPKPGRPIGETGSPMSNLWGWTLSFRASPTAHKSDASAASQLGSAEADSEEDAQLRATRYRRLSRPLEKKSLWPATTILQN
jgi:hypothetical protein